MGAIEEIYAELDADVSEEEFRGAVEAKIEQMGELVDEETAARLIAHELTESEVNGVADIEPGMEEAKFVAKVLSIGELREFDREGEDEPGRVVNVEVADETGSVRVAFWDEMATSTAEELDPGDVLRIQGRPKEGLNGVEVSASHAEIDEDVEIEVAAGETLRIEDLTLGRSDVTLRGRVLGTEPVRTFQRDDGSEGRVANLVLGDPTGRVRVTLWDERAELAEEFEAGESVEVVDGYVREREGDLELHVGNRGTVERIEADVEYVPDTTPIEALEEGDTVDLAGVVRSADPKRTFERDDGSEGQVKNIRLQDQTGDIRVALWGEKADLDLTPGDEVQLADVEIQDGWQDDLEAAANWRSTVTLLEDGADPTGDADTGDDDGAEAGLAAFADGVDAAADDASGTAGPPGGDADGGDAVTADGPVEFTGVVVQAGDPVVLDDGEETVSLTADVDVELGQELTVRGERREGRIDPETVTVE